MVQTCAAAASGAADGLAQSFLQAQGQTACLLHGLWLSSQSPLAGGGKRSGSLCYATGLASMHVCKEMLTTYTAVCVCWSPHRQLTTCLDAWVPSGCTDAGM